MPEETMPQTQAAPKRGREDMQVKPERIRSSEARSDKPKASPIAAFSKEEELSVYRTMLLIRRFEEKAGQLYGMGMIGGFCHLYIGQEAVVVGLKMAMRDGDQVITG